MPLCPAEESRFQSVCRDVKESTTDSALRNNFAERPNLHAVNFPVLRLEA